MARLCLLLGFTLGLLAPGAHAAGQIGDASRGQTLFSQCSGCHQVGAGAINRVGPHLNNIYGRPAAGLDGFAYSKSMVRAGADGLVWHLDTIDAYLENPRALVSRTRMSFRGFSDPQDRADVMAYLRRFTASPQDIPEAEPTARADLPDLDPAILAIEGDPDYGAYLSSECSTCHQRDGGDAGIPAITLWPEEDFVVAMHAYKQKLRPHPVMQMMAGRLSDEEIAALAAYFARLEE
ncbi:MULTISPECIES: c-type cytochrome [unclassified Meridianimarinicoccus]|uniref:c-type cytochrome n=1 Tax=unclassified Meridianimarinicoccus TaxID=2923344 RepID=UPI0018696A90|nr:c-type cytochrome [Fluviibacterium sp. MJW13]